MSHVFADNGIIKSFPGDKSRSPLFIVRIRENDVDSAIQSGAQNGVGNLHVARFPAVMGGFGERDAKDGKWCHVPKCSRERVNTLLGV